MRLPVTGHPTDEELAAYLSGSLALDQRQELEAHLAECRACRTQVTSARRLLRTQPQPARRVVAASLAAAAVIAVLLWLPRLPGPSTESDSDVRSSEPGLSETLRPIVPPDGDTVSRRALRFAWHSEPGDLLYRLTITTPSGEAVWDGETDDTTLTPPPDLRLSSDGKFFWFVDALDVSGRALTTGPQTVWIAP